MGLRTNYLVPQPHAIIAFDFSAVYRFISRSSYSSLQFTSLLHGYLAGRFLAAGGLRRYDRGSFLLCLYRSVYVYGCNFLV